MPSSRRGVLQMGGTALGVAMAGCGSFPIGRPIYVPIVLQNNHHIPHMMSISITSLIPDVGSGWTEFFTDTSYLEPGDEETFEERLAVPDAPVQVMALVVLEDETAKQEEFSLDFELRELRVLITENGQIRIQPRS